MNENQILKKYQNMGKMSGEELMLPKVYILDFIKDCKDNNIAILGFDGIKVTEKYHIPDMEAIADFSSLFEKEKDWELIVKESIAASKKFLEIVKDKDISFIPVLMDRHEFEAKNFG